MADDTPPLPTGFSLDADATATPPEHIPALPDGFSIDKPKALTTHPVLAAGAQVAGDALTDLPKFAVGMGENALSGITAGAGSLADALTLSDPGTHKWGYRPRTTAGQDIANLGNAESGVASDVYDAAAGTGSLAQTLKERLPEAAGAVGTVTGLKAGLGSAAEGAANVAAPRLMGSIGEAGPTSAMTPEAAIAAQTASLPTNMGAAAAAPDISRLRPASRQVIQQAGVSNAPVNVDAVARHNVIDSLPMPEGETPAPLTRGQATQDAQQISDEINMRADADTHGILANSIKNQNLTLGSSMGEIRRQAGPDIVQRSTPENAQAAIDAVKTLDNSVVTDTRAKYKALADQNGGTMPIDTGQVIGQINDTLGNKFLTKTAAQNPDISEVMDMLGSGKPMTFEQFENARTNLAEVQRAKGNPAAAAGVVRNALENMPLTPEAQQLKGLADSARSAAKSRFDVIKQNPAYAAVVDDNVPKDANGLHVIGADSPLADKFMDNYFLGNGPNASRALVGRMQALMNSDPNFSQAVEGASLNKLRDAAGLDEYDTGTFRADNYRNARNGLNNKADVLMSPKSVAGTEQLKQAASLYNGVPKEGSVNRSNTALTLQRFGAPMDMDPSIWGHLADVGTDVAAAHTLGPVGVGATSLIKGIGKTVLRGRKDAAAAQALRNSKLKFAQDATAPGAGIAGQPVTTPIPRATGGKVAHKPTVDELADRLYKRWRAAQKETTKATEPLLRRSDESITRALAVANEAI